MVKDVTMNRELSIDICGKSRGVSCVICVIFLDYFIKNVDDVVDSRLFFSANDYTLLFTNLTIFQFKYVQ